MNGKGIKAMLGLGLLTLALAGLLAMSVGMSSRSWAAFEPPGRVQPVTAPVSRFTQGTAAARWEAEHRRIEALAEAHGSNPARARAIADAVMLVRYPGEGLGR